jgi:hypothetical protein
MDTTLRVVEGSVSRPSCVMPGAVISGIIWPVYGQLQIGCNSSLSYRWAAIWLTVHSCGFTHEELGSNQKRCSVAMDMLLCAQQRPLRL